MDFDGLKPAKKDDCPPIIKDRKGSSSFVLYLVEIPLTF